MSNGSVITMGGTIGNKAGTLKDGRFGITIYSPGNVKLNLVGNMSFPRWYPSVTLLPNQKIMVMGGNQVLAPKINKYYEIWVRNSVDDSVLYAQAILQGCFILISKPWWSDDAEYLHAC